MRSPDHPELLPEHRDYIPAHRDSGIYFGTPLYLDECAITDEGRRLRAALGVDRPNWIDFESFTGDDAILRRGRVSGRSNARGQNTRGY